MMNSNDNTTMLFVLSLAGGLGCILAYVVNFM